MKHMPAKKSSDSNFSTASASGASVPDARAEDPRAQKFCSVSSAAAAPEIGLAAAGSESGACQLHPNQTETNVSTQGRT